MIAEGYAEFETIVNAVFVDLANIVIDAAGAQAGAGDVGVDGQLARKHADLLGAGHENFVGVEEVFELIEERGIIGDDFARLLQPAGWQVDAATAEAHIVAHHARAGERLEEVENFFALAKGIHQRSAERAHVHEEEPGEAGVIDDAGQLGGDDADVFGALGRLETGEFFDGERVGPVVGERTEVIEAIRVRHRPKVAGGLGDLFVVAMEVAEDRFQSHHGLAIENNVHAKDTVRGWVLRSHGDFEQFAIALFGQQLEILRGHFGDCAHVFTSAA